MDVYGRLRMAPRARLLSIDRKYVLRKGASFAKYADTPSKTPESSALCGALVLLFEATALRWSCSAFDCGLNRSTQRIGQSVLPAFRS